MAGEGSVPYGTPVFIHAADWGAPEGWMDCFKGQAEQEMAELINSFPSRRKREVHPEDSDLLKPDERRQLVERSILKCIENTGPGILSNRQLDAIAEHFLCNLRKPHEKRTLRDVPVFRPLTTQWPYWNQNIKYGDYEVPLNPDDAGINHFPKKVPDKPPPKLKSAKPQKPNVKFGDISVIKFKNGCTSQHVYPIEFHPASQEEYQQVSVKPIQPRLACSDPCPIQFHRTPQQDYQKASPKPMQPRLVCSDPCQSQHEYSSIQRTNPKMPSPMDAPNSTPTLALNGLPPLLQKMFGTIMTLSSKYSLTVGRQDTCSTPGPERQSVQERPHFPYSANAAFNERSHQRNLFGVEENCNSSCREQHPKFKTPRNSMLIGRNEGPRSITSAPDRRQRNCTRFDVPMRHGMYNEPWSALDLAGDPRATCNRYQSIVEGADLPLMFRHPSYDSLLDLKVTDLHFTQSDTSLSRFSVTSGDTNQSNRLGKDGDEFFSTFCPPSVISSMIMGQESSLESRNLNKFPRRRPNHLPFSLKFVEGDKITPNIYVPSKHSWENKSIEGDSEWTRPGNQKAYGLDGKEKPSAFCPLLEDRAMDMQQECPVTTSRESELASRRDRIHLPSAFYCPPYEDSSIDTRLESSLPSCIDGELVFKQPGMQLPPCLEREEIIPEPVSKLENGYMDTILQDCLPSCIDGELVFTQSTVPPVQCLERDENPASLIPKSEDSSTDMRLESPQTSCSEGYLALQRPGIQLPVCLEEIASTFCPASEDSRMNERPESPLPSCIEGEFVWKGTGIQSPSFLESEEITAILHRASSEESYMNTRQESPLPSSCSEGELALKRPRIHLPNRISAMCDQHPSAQKQFKVFRTLNPWDDQTLSDLEESGDSNTTERKVTRRKGATASFPSSSTSPTRKTTSSVEFCMLPPTSKDDKSTRIWPPSLPCAGDADQNVVSPGTIALLTH